MKSLNLYWLDKADHLLAPADVASLTLDDPALSLLSNLRIDSHVPAILAHEGFLSEQVSSKLVVNQDHQLVGIVSRQDLSEQNILRIQSESRMARQTILVADLMTPRAALLAMEYADLQQATVRDVLAALQAAGEAHCLVLDRHSHNIHGMISVTDIAARLHQPVVIERQPTVINLCSLPT